MTDSLLPPNATPLERALEQAMARIGHVAAPVTDLWDPWTCPPELLPWLAWSLSVYRWDADWSLARKRAVVAGSIVAHRRKGTRASIETVLAGFDALLHVVEWWEKGGDPLTFDIVLPLSGPGIVPGGERATAAFAAAVAEDVTRAKPLRTRFRFVQSLSVLAPEGVVPVTRAALYARPRPRLIVDDSQPWADLIQTEDGAPLQDDAGRFIDGSAA